MQKFEEQLRAQLATGDTEIIVRWMMQLLYESYKHGLKSRDKSKRPPRKPESRSK